MPELGGEELSENVLEMVKNHERVEYNEDNGVFEYRVLFNRLLQTITDFAGRARSQLDPGIDLRDQEKVSPSRRGEYKSSASIVAAGCACS